MLNNVFLNNFSIPKYKANSKQNLSFAGKSFVQLKLLDETFLVPKAVANVRRSVKCAFTEDNDNCFCSNSVNLKDNIFIGISHFLRYLNKKYEINIGKTINNPKTKEKTYSVNKAKKHNNNIELDLSIFKSEMTKFWQVSKSTPLKLAFKMPEKEEDIFIVAYHPDFAGPKVIPATYKGRCSSNAFINEEFGAYSDYFEINSELLKNKLNPTCLSGAAIVNKKAELIGLQGKALIDSSNSMSTGKLFGIDIWTIRKYLKDNNISI